MAPLHMSLSCSIPTPAQAQKLARPGHTMTQRGNGHLRHSQMPQTYFPPAVLSDSTSINTVSVLKPCADNQYRNPDTNRCNTISDAVAILTPCNAGEERNPETNRCRAIAAAAIQPAPCPAGSERNIDTNRCRKITTATTANTVKDLAAPSVDNNGWFIAVLVTGLAAAYGVYEWRQDIKLLARKVQERVTALPKRFRR